MDGVPYPQPLAGHEPQYVPGGVLLVRPIGRPPKTVPPRAADQRSWAYPTLLRVLRLGRYGRRGGPQTPEVRLHACVPCGLLLSCSPPTTVLGSVVGLSPLLAWVRWWCWGGGSSPLLDEVLMWASPPPLAGARCRRRRVVPRQSWLRVLGAAPRHSWLESAGGAGAGRPSPLLGEDRWFLERV